jgi:hypothetical protein
VTIYCSFVEGTCIIIKNYLNEIGLEAVDWIYLAQDRDKWRALVKAVMNLRIPQNARSSWQLLEKDSGPYS